MTTVRNRRRDEGASRWRGQQNNEYSLSQCSWIHQLTFRAERRDLLSHKPRKTWHGVIDLPVVVVIHE